jgi:multicomponent Na+:H+ antiporter subunit C
MVERVLGNLNYLLAMGLFAVGMHTLLTHSNLIKKIIGLNIMETAVFLLIISLGYVRGGMAPIDLQPGQVAVHPLPSALVLTGIVIAVSTTAYALSLVIRIHEQYGTVDADELARIMRGQGQ